MTICYCGNHIALHNCVTAAGPVAKGTSDGLYEPRCITRYSCWVKPPCIKRIFTFHVHRRHAATCITIQSKRALGCVVFNYTVQMFRSFLYVNSHTGMCVLFSLLKRGRFRGKIILNWATFNFMARRASSRERRQQKVETFLLWLYVQINFLSQRLRWRPKSPSFNQSRYSFKNWLRLLPDSYTSWPTMNYSSSVASRSATPASTFPFWLSL